MAEEEAANSRQAEQQEQLSVVATATDDVHVLTLAGEIDHDTGDTLRQALHLPGTPRPRVVIDMRQVTFMDSSGINVLLAAHHTLARAGGWLRLAAPTDTVMRTLRIVGVDAVIDCRDTLHHALAP
ncbi:STAS domain-containing protein [Streptomyces sp. NPDC017936]|uniref:STAS domain-containing protein n=1 Tax=Streptomyces sp. NPDC017936 TaxID=3365016 RepID=UPI0037BDD34F